MVNLQFLSGLNTIGANIIDIWTETTRVIFDYGEISNPDTGELPDLTETAQETAILISHLHIDHTGSLRTVPKDIPIYMSKESYDLYQMLIEIGEEQPIEATIYPLEYNQEKQIGDIKVTAKKSDHDIKGVCAFFVHTPDIKLIYSGDVRLTGNHPQNVFDWMEDAKEFKADILLLEGTAYSFEEEEEEREVLSEQQLLQKWEALLQTEKNKIVFLNTYVRDIERLKIFLVKAKALGREVILEPKHARLLNQLEDFQDTYVLKELDMKQEFEDRWIDLQTIKQNPQKFVLQNSYKSRMMITEFEEGIYCHSNGEPLGDYDPRYSVLLEELESNCFSFEPMGTSGHATKTDLIKIAQEVNAKVTIPWHSFYPEKLMEALAASGLSSFSPERGITYSTRRENKYD